MSTHGYKPAKWFRECYGTTSAGLRSWESKGLISALRFPGGKRSYSVEQVELLLHVPAGKEPEKKSYIYARVSSAKQKGDLARQVGRLVSAYPSHMVIQDIGSGVNFKRRGLRTLLDRVHEGLVREIVVLHKDRLSRFASDLLDWIFQKAGVKLVVHCADEDLAGSSELAEDLLAITTVFVASHNGKRSAQNRKTAGQTKNAESSQRSQEAGGEPNGRKRPRTSRENDL